MDKVIELAREAGMGGDAFGWLASNHAIEKFYLLARADLEAENDRLSAHMTELRALHAKRIEALEAENAKLYEALEHCMNILEIEVSRGLRMNLPAQH